MQQIRAAELATWLADPQRPAPLLLDVRESWEIELCQIPGTHHLPMHLIPTQLEALDGTPEIVVICHHGVRSMQVALFLERQGFDGIYNLSGGIEAWANDIDPAMRRY